MSWAERARGDHCLFRAARSADIARYAIRLRSGLRQSGGARCARRLDVGTKVPAYLIKALYGPREITPANKFAGDPDTRALPVWGWDGDWWHESRGEEVRYGVTRCVCILYPTLRKRREGWAPGYGLGISLVVSLGSSAVIRELVGFIVFLINSFFFCISRSRSHVTYLPTRWKRTKPIGLATTVLPS